MGSDAVIDVVVVNYRTPRDVQTFFSTFNTYAPIQPYRLTLINVCPTDEDLNAMHAFTESMAFSENIGYGRACNLAVRHPSMVEINQPPADYLVFCNADIQWTEGALEQMINAMEENPNWGVLGPRQVDPAGQLVHAGIFGTRAQPRHRAWKHLDGPQYHDVATAVTVSGSLYVVRRACWDELVRCSRYEDWVANAKSTGHCGIPESGAFLPTPFYYEETWFSYHAIEHGWKVIYFGPVGVIHNWHNSVRTNNAEGWASAQMRVSQAMFREACDAHGIPHD